MIVLDVSHDISGEEYQALMQELAERAETAGLVVRNFRYLSPGAINFLASIRPHLVRESLKEEWPGTRLHKHKATVLEYDISADFIGKVLAFSDHLFLWGQDDMPQDLFFKQDDIVVLETVGHENMAYIRVEVMSSLLASMIEAQRLTVVSM